MTPEQREQAKARSCGMNTTEWRQARDQASRNRGRGKRATGDRAKNADKVLAEWGECDGQDSLF